MLPKKQFLLLFLLLWLALFMAAVKTAQAFMEASPGVKEESRAKHIDISLSLTSKRPDSNQISGGIKLEEKGLIAIVIDDFGQSSDEGVNEILSLGIPVTCAVMPNLENTLRHAEEVAKKGHQVIVHLPLEPVIGNHNWLGPGAITMNLTEEEIKFLAKKDFDAVPHAVGFNNHMGSAVTANDRIMRIILETALGKKFFVLDSATTMDSKIPALSVELGIPWVKRDVFLDSVNSLDYVKGQLDLLSRKALKQGKAIGIGHVGKGGKITAQALKETIPQMKEMGIEFVYLTRVLNTNSLEKVITH